MIDARRKAEYERFFQETPWIAWREPLPASTVGASGLACRMCVAMYGLGAQQIAKLPQSRQEFELHLREFHNVTDVTYVASTQATVGNLGRSRDK